MVNSGRKQERFEVPAWKTVLSLFLALLAFAGCGEDGASDEGTKTSGLPGALQLTALSDENRKVFCEWYESVAPSEESCPRSVEEGEKAPTCLEKFEHFGACTVEAAERCLSSASASSCELPDTEACRAFRACQEEAAPANDCTDGAFTCMKFIGPTTTWKGKSYTWGRCWSWWPPGCVKCNGDTPSSTWAEAWCEEQHPDECKNRACFAQFKLF